jgi:hypothetical protein
MGLSSIFTIGSLDNDMKSRSIPLWSLILFFLFGSVCRGEQKLLAVKVSDPPAVDGIAEDSAWKNGPVLTTYDKAGDLQIKVKAVYTDSEIFLLVNFPDPDESRTHKSWIWDDERNFYTVGNDREDIFIVKWNMEPTTVDLSIYSDNAYTADIWFWKACRTDSRGYADDKIHKLGTIQDRYANEIVSRTGLKTYLLRQGDVGDSVYQINLISAYQGETLPRYVMQRPTDSRSDVRAKGVWQDGRWTVEFGRKLITGNRDDIQFNSLGKEYLFGLSRYEIAGRKPNANLSDPLYGTGDVSEPLWLEFIK